MPCPCSCSTISAAREEMVYGQRWGSGDEEDQCTQSGDDLIYPPYPFFTSSLFYRPVSPGEQWSKEKRGEVNWRILEHKGWGVCGTAFWIHKWGKKKNNNHSETAVPAASLGAREFIPDQGEALNPCEVKGKINPP